MFQCRLCSKQYLWGACPSSPTPGCCCYPTPCWEESLKSWHEKTGFCDCFHVSVCRNYLGQQTLGQCLVYGHVVWWSPLLNGTRAEVVWLGLDQLEQKQLFVMTAYNHHRAAYSNSLIWIDWGGDIHLSVHFSMVLNVNPAFACHTNCLLSLSQIAFPWSKVLVFFSLPQQGNKAQWQGMALSSLIFAFFFFFFFFNLVQSKGLLVNISSWKPVQNSSLQHLWLPSSPRSNMTDRSHVLVQNDLCLVPPAGSVWLPYNSCIFNSLLQNKTDTYFLQRLEFWFAPWFKIYSLV